MASRKNSSFKADISTLNLNEKKNEKKYLIRTEVKKTEIGLPQNDIVASRDLSSGGAQCLQMP